MGNRGRSWVALFAFWALAILIAAFGRSVPEPAPVVGVVEARIAAAPAVAPAAIFVASR